MWIAQICSEICSVLRLRTFLLGITLLGWAGPALAIDNPGLAGVHQKVAGQFSDVRHIAPTGFNALKPVDVLLLDVREPDEFAVSHLRGAQRVSPTITVDDFVRRFASLAVGKRVVFYCSVGQRSSKLASRLQPQLMAAGASSVQNLTGGIFNWHNLRRPLVNRQGPTEFVHPYSWWWGRHIERGALRRYKPTGQ